MFKWEDIMCCSTCFVEMHTLLTDEDGRPISYICPNCCKLTDLTDEL